MKAPDLPPDEDARLQVLRNYEFLDSPREQDFDDLALLAARIVGTPIALVSLVDADRQWFKARVGLDAAETGRDISFCGHVVVDREMLVVQNALEAPRFADNPLVAGPPNIRFYAGAPLISPGDYYLGTLCVIDQVPRELTVTQTEQLQALARQVVSQLELRLINRNLITARVRAEAAERARADFLGHMSHELRTPLNAIIGYSELLTEVGEVVEEAVRVEYARYILDGGEQLLSLVNDVLDLRRVEEGKFSPQADAFSVSELVAAAERSVRPLAQKRGNTVAWEVDDQFFLSDLRMLRQSLLNLVANAVRFTKDGTVTVRASVHDERLRVEVQDDGGA